MSRTTRRIRVSLLRYNVDKPGRQTKYAQVRILARKNEDEKLQQTVHVIYELEEFIQLLDFCL